MEFTDVWLTNDTEALNLTCEVIVPVMTVSVSDNYGIGGVTTQSEQRHTLACMEVPERLMVNYEQGAKVKIAKDLVIKDIYDYIQPQREIYFQGERFRIGDQIAPTQHTLKRVTLEHIS